MESGTRLGPYEIKKQLGAGGMGEVYLAKDGRLGREVAIKVLPPQFATDPERLARFDQEARAAAALNHPHIAVVHDIGHEDGTYFIVQERLEGQPLRDLLEGGRPALGKTLDLCIEIAEALTAAHGAGIVHRDLKPDNVFVSKDGHAKVLDFGLAKLMEMSPVVSPGGASMSPTMVGTVAGQVMGTAGYMAPEQIEGGEIDHRADIFAFGVLLYEMATGRQPFVGRNVVDTLSLITNEQPPELIDVDDSLPRALQRILHKALAKDPAERYQSAADMLVDLRSLAADVEAGRAVAVSVGRAPAGASRYPAWLLVASVVTAMALGAAAFAMLSGPDAAPPQRSWVFETPYPEGQAAVPCCAAVIAVAPDGSYFVYSADTEDGRVIFLRRHGSSEAVRVPGALGSGLTISPDGRWIAYAGQFGGQRGLFKVALSGGDPFWLGEHNGWSNPWWGDDGSIYFAQAGAAIQRVPETGGDAELIEVQGLDGDEQLASLAALPGGRFLVAAAGVPQSNEAWRIGAVDLSSGQWTEVVPEGDDPRWSASGHLLYTRDGALYALPFDATTASPRGQPVPVVQDMLINRASLGHFGVGSDGTLVYQRGKAGPGAGPQRQLVAANTTGVLQPIIDRVEPYSFPRLSPDGTRAVVAIADDFVADLWILEIDRGVLSPLTVDGGTIPVWSADGSVVYFMRLNGGLQSIYRIPADFSGDAELVLEDGGPPASAHPDGSTLLFERRSQESSAIMALSLADPDAEPIPVVARPALRQRGARYSPDGRYVAYVSNESGTSQIYLRESDGSRRWSVSPAFGSSPTWAADGRRLYYTVRGGIEYVEIAWGPEVTIGRPIEAYTGNGRGPYGVFPDGSVLLTTELEADQPEADLGGITVVLNWFDELNRLAPGDR